MGVVAETWICGGAPEERVFVISKMPSQEVPAIYRSSPALCRSMCVRQGDRQPHTYHKLDLEIWIWSFLVYYVNVYSHEKNVNCYHMCLVQWFLVCHHHCAQRGCQQVSQAPLDSTLCLELRGSQIEVCPWAESGPPSFASSSNVEKSSGSGYL